MSEERWWKLFDHWQLDDWSMSKEMFAHIHAILPENSTILELGAGKTTQLLNKFFDVWSIEEDQLYCTSSQVLHVPVTRQENKDFPNDPTWYDPGKLREQLQKVPEYKAIIIDGPKGYRGGFWKHRHLFDLNNTWLFFDDLMAEEHMKLAIKVAQDLGKDLRIIRCSKNPKATTWLDGKLYGVISV